MEKLKRCQMMLMKDREGQGQPVSQQLTHQTQQQQQQQQPQSMQQMSSHPQTQAPSHMATSGSHLPQYSQQPHVSQMSTQGSTGMGQGPGPYQGYPTTMHGQGPMQGQQSPMQSHSMGMGARQQPPPSYPQGPLAYLEQTTSNIGMPERR